MAKNSHVKVVQQGSKKPKETLLEKQQMTHLVQC
uniref:Uncharacterized protein n=1 Tax=Arundo donax TaxID=35708 RepID=A0A0A9AWB3_ARUDO